MGVQLSLKAALPLAGILATASDRCDKTRPRSTRGPSQHKDTILPVYKSIIKKRQSDVRLIFIMEISIPGNIFFILRRGPASVNSVLDLANLCINWFLLFLLVCWFPMMTSSNGNIFRVTTLCAGNSPVAGEFPAQRPVTRSFDVFFDLPRNKWLSKQPWGWWFETPS